MPVHKFLPNSDEKITNEMLQKLGLKGIDQLYSDVPDHLQLKRPLGIPRQLSEIELERTVESKLGRNRSGPEFLNFLGGGVWLHHVPSIVDEILSRGEFYTAYTPYQAEISQGMLQGMFEYQSQICDLTEMGVANSSMYDYGTALGESGRMAVRVTKRRKILVPKNVSPERKEVLRTYCYPAGVELQEVNFDNETGQVGIESLKEKLDDQVAAVYIENPNFFGVIEEAAQEIGSLAHSKGALFIVGANPITLGVLKPPGRYGADIVVGDGQPIGLYPNFGGPLIGIFAIKNETSLLRQMPGRLIGLTTSKDGSRRGYAMVLQTREQHIRREQATSNICTNEALFALAVSIYLSCMGPEGMRQVGDHILANSHFAQKRLEEEGLVTPFFSGSFFGDLSIKTNKVDSVELSKRLVDYRILGGLPMGRFYRGDKNLASVSLFSFTEIHSEQDIESLVEALKQIEGS